MTVQIQALQASRAQCPVPGAVVAAAPVMGAPGEDRS